MEGGLLTHASRIANGSGIYVPPSIAFVPFPYPPLYPGLIAGIGSLLGISYLVGRVISIISVAAIALLLIAEILRTTNQNVRLWAYSGTAIGLGLLSATYPWVEGMVRSRPRRHAICRTCSCGIIFDLLHTLKLYQSPFPDRSCSNTSHREFLHQTNRYFLRWCWCNPLGCLESAPTSPLTSLPLACSVWGAPGFSIAILTVGSGPTPSKSCALIQSIADE